MELLKHAAALNKISKEYLCAIVQHMMELLKHAAALNEILMQYKIATL